MVQVSSMMLALIAAQANDYVPVMRLDVSPAVYARTTALPTHPYTLPGIGFRLAPQLTPELSLGLSVELATQLGCGKSVSCGSMGLVAAGARYSFVDYRGLSVFVDVDVGVSQLGQRTDLGDDSTSGLTSRVGIGLSRGSRTLKNLRIGLMIRYGHVFAGSSSPGLPTWDFIQFSLPVQTAF
jgi:hypothetical protein